MRFEIASPSPVPPFFWVIEFVGLLEFLEQLGLIGFGNARTGVAHRKILYEPSTAGRPDSHFPLIGELDRVADRD